MLNHTNTSANATMMMLAAGFFAAAGCAMDESELSVGQDQQAVILPNVILPNVISNVILPNVILPNGTQPADHTFNGFSFNPASSAGLSIAGAGIDTVAIDGLVVNGSLTVNGQALSADQEAAFEVLAAYLVHCSVPAGQSVTITSSTGEDKVYHGAMGLAAEWMAGALSDTGKHFVSACIAARSNANGQRVLISLRGGDMAISATEKATFQHAEGAFWGNVFGDAPYVSSCSALGGGIAGRDCTDGSCYFADAGSCASACTAQSATDGSFSDCAGHAAVITTFLPTTSNDSFDGHHDCDIDAAGTVICSGDNKQGQLGNGTTQNTNAADASAVVFADDVPVAEIVSGKKHTCARQANGTVRCWGKNKDGQAGLGSNANKILAPSTDAALITNAMSLRSGADHSCALEADGTVLCWGKNKAGELGDATSHNSDVPVITELSAAAIHLATGNQASHSCAITALGQLECWGKNKNGQLGDDSHHNRSTPVAVAGLTDLTDVCVGKKFTCALDAAGQVSCFGKINNSETPVAVALSQAATAISCDKNDACATLADGSEQCW